MDNKIYLQLNVFRMFTTLYIKVLKQRYIGKNFFNGQRYFDASNGIRLESGDYPAHYPNGIHDHIIFLRGTIISNDYREFHISREDLNSALDMEYRINEACKEYNSAQNALSMVNATNE